MAPRGSGLVLDGCSCRCGVWRDNRERATSHISAPDKEVSFGGWMSLTPRTTANPLSSFWGTSSHWHISCSMLDLLAPQVLFEELLF